MADLDANPFAKSHASVLIIQLRAMGDTLLATPVIRALKRAFPHLNIDFLAEPLPAQVLTNNPYLRQVVITTPRKAAFTEYTKLIRGIRAARYQITIDFLSTPGSAWLTRFTGAPVRIGFGLPWRRWAYTIPVEREVVSRYYPLTKFNFLKDLLPKPWDVSLDLGIDDSSAGIADELWSRLVPDQGKTPVALAPWSKRLKRRWPVENWLRFLRATSQSGDFIWLMFASESERKELAPVFNDNSLNVEWAGAKDLIVAAALIKRCKTMVGVDNGPKHIAVAVGTPTITVFVASNPLDVNDPNDPLQMAVDYRAMSDSRSQVDLLVNRFKASLKQIEITGGKI